MNMEMITPKELAERFGTDQKLIRKFLREVTPEGARPGRGSRWAIPGNKREMTRLTKQFEEWSVKHKRALEKGNGEETEPEEQGDETE